MWRCPVGSFIYGQTFDQLESVSVVRAKSSVGWAFNASKGSRNRKRALLPGKGVSCVGTLRRR